MTRFRRFLGTPFSGVWIACSLLLAIGGVVPPASADPDPQSPGEQQFIADLLNAGLTAKNGEKAMIAAGYSICGAMANGRTREYETNVIYGSVDGLTQAQAQTVVNSAIADLCPNAAPVSAAKDVSTTERAVKAAYVQKLASCSGTSASATQSIVWDKPGFSESTGGSGMVADVIMGHPAQFIAMWVVGRWDIQIDGC